jgi:hypothetical protein
MSSLRCRRISKRFTLLNVADSCVCKQFDKDSFHIDRVLFSLNVFLIRPSASKINCYRATYLHLQINNPDKQVKHRPQNLFPNSIHYSGLSTHYC